MLSPADDAFATRLAETVPGLRIGAPEPRHLEEPRGRYHGLGGLLVRPRSEEHTSELQSR